MKQQMVSLRKGDPDFNVSKMLAASESVFISKQDSYWFSLSLVIYYLNLEGFLLKCRSSSLLS